MERSLMEACTSIYSGKSDMARDNTWWPKIFFLAIFYFVASAATDVAPNFECNTLFTSSCFLANLHVIVSSVTRINPNDNQNQKLSLHLRYTGVNVERMWWEDVSKTQRYRMTESQPPEFRERNVSNDRSQNPCWWLSIVTWVHHSWKETIFNYSKIFISSQYVTITIVISNSEPFTLWCASTHPQVGIPLFAFSLSTIITQDIILVSLVCQLPLFMTF